MFYKCTECNNDSLIEVGHSDGIPFYSCFNEDCLWYAILKVRLENGTFIHHNTLLDALLKTVKEDEQNNISESES